MKFEYVLSAHRERKSNSLYLFRRAQAQSKAAIKQEEWIEGRRKEKES